MTFKKQLLGWFSATLLFAGIAQAAPITLATKSFTEQHILSAMTVQYLQKKGFQVQPQTNIATVISRNAMINKQIDMTWEYTGTSLIIFNHINKRMPTGVLRHGKTAGRQTRPGVAKTRGHE